VDRHSGNQTLLSNKMFEMSYPQTFFEGYHTQGKGKQGKEITNAIHFRDLNMLNTLKIQQEVLFVLTIARKSSYDLIQKNLGQ